MERPKYDHEFARRVHEEQLWRENVARMEHEQSGETVYHVSQKNGESQWSGYSEWRNILEDVREAARKMWESSTIRPDVYERDPVHGDTYHGIPWVCGKCDKSIEPEQRRTAYFVDEGMDFETLEPKRALYHAECIERRLI